ncbi:MAG: beta-propeller domain-containing protein [Actinomycetota bacterium]
MTDPFEKKIGGIDSPRALDPDFRERLQRMIVEGVVETGSVEDDVRWRIDGPRPMPPRLRRRVEAKLLRRRLFRPSLPTTSIAAIVLILTASAVVIVSNRTPEPARRVIAPTPSPSVTPSVTPSSPGTRPAARPPGSLYAFGSASEFLRYVRGEALQLVGPYGIEGGGMYGTLTGDVISMPASGSGTAQPGTPVSMPAMASAPAGVAHSTTNVQEDGVDEPDIVKNDGERIAVLSQGKLWLLEVTAGGARLVSSMSAPNASSLLLAGDRVVLFTTLYGAPPAARRATHVTNRVWTSVKTVGITDLHSPRILSSFEVEGSYVGARLAGGIVRLAIQSGVLGPQPVPVEGDTTSSLRVAETGNKRLIRNSSVGDWLPHYVIERAGRLALTGHVHGWSAITRPPDHAGVGMLTLLTIDPADPRPDNALSVVGAGDIIYSSANSFYVTSNTLNDVLATRRGKAPASPVTRIHKFDISNPSRASYAGSGAVPGFLLNQFSLSELDGNLRVATTHGFPWLGEDRATTKSVVTVLKQIGNRLLPVGSVGDIGKGEKIYSVRFIGSMAYVVTFRQVDPLFVVDLRVPNQPVLRGELKVSGYSGYLHPISEKVLLGIGRDAEDTGQAKGLQISLFDVSDPDHPARIGAMTFGVMADSMIEQDHRAFLYWSPNRLAVIPATIWEESNDRTPWVGALTVVVNQETGFGRIIRITHEGRPAKNKSIWAAIRRSLVIGDSLFTVSDRGVLVSDLATLDDAGWIAFG